jgi:hypothetical protein
MSTSQRASASIRQMPESERPISEQFRVVAKAWVDANAAAELLEETKTAVLAQMMVAKGDMPVSRAEMLVKASKEWHEHVAKIVEARKAANLLKVQMKYTEIKFSEWQASDATARAEMRLSR